MLGIVQKNHGVIKTLEQKPPIIKKSSGVYFAC